MTRRFLFCRSGGHDKTGRLLCLGESVAIGIVPLNGTSLFSRRITKLPPLLPVPEFSKHLQKYPFDYPSISKIYSTNCLILQEKYLLWFGSKGTLVLTFCELPSRRSCASFDSMNHLKFSKGPSCETWSICKGHLWAIFLALLKILRAVCKQSL